METILSNLQALLGLISGGNLLLTAGASVAVHVQIILLTEELSLVTDEPGSREAFPTFRAGKAFRMEALLHSLNQFYGDGFSAG